MNSANLARAVAAGAAEAVVAGLREHGGNSGVQLNSCAALYCLTAACGDNRTRAGGAGAVEAVVGAINANAADHRILQLGVAALSTLANGNRNNQDRGGASGAVEAVVASMRAHVGNSEVQVHGCQALHRLAAANSNTQAWGIEAGAVEAGAAAVGGKLEASAAEGAPPVPWKEIVATTPFRALTYVHFCQNWGHFTLLSWLPTYFSQLLGLDLTNAALVSLLPPITGIIASSFAAPLADRMVGDGMEVGRVRKISMTVAFMGPAFFLLGGTISDNHVLQVALLSIGVGLQNFSLTGLYCNHGDLSPTYAAVLLGMTNTIGALPGIIGVAFAGVRGRIP
mmetsp:Transcript_56729/g.179305  ORF Transcript_56729/g.179305 Transcript_56729/m.179305 type:complete len:339 (+) Transcript_56729:165-1181(+)